MAGGPARQPQPPVERQHERLGGIGGFFHTLGSGWHERVRGGGFNPLRGATTGVVMRRRATSGEMARGGLVFVFFFGGCSDVGGGFFHMLGSGQTRMPPQSGGTRGCFGGGGALLPFVLRVVAGACVGRWTGQARMPPRERQHEGLGGLGDSFTRSGVDGTRGLGVGGLIRCAGRPREWSCGAVPPQERWHEGGWFLFFSLEVAPVSEGDSFTPAGVASHACRRGSGSTRG